MEKKFDFHRWLPIHDKLAPKVTIHKNDNMCNIFAAYKSNLRNSLDAFWKSASIDFSEKVQTNGTKLQ